MTWKSEINIKYLSSSSKNSMNIEIKFVKGSRIKTKRWVVYKDSDIFKIECRLETDGYVTTSPMLYSISHWLFDNTVKDDPELRNMSQSEFNEWKKMYREKWGDTYIKNERSLWFGDVMPGREGIATIYRESDVWFLRFDNGLSFEVTIL